MTSNNDVLKKIALIEEFDASFKLCVYGLAEVQKLNRLNTFYHLPFQLLSQGIERLLKGFICCAYYEKNNEYPSIGYLRRSLGHDLDKLLNVIIEEYFVTHQLRQIRIDRDFLIQDLNFKKLLRIFSEFGKYARYDNFDIIVGVHNDYSCITEIEELKTIIMHDKQIDIYRFDSVDDNFVNEALSEIYIEIVILLEKFISAIIRQINFGSIGSDAKGYVVGNYFTLGKMFEGDFGKTDYRMYKL